MDTLKTIMLTTDFSETSRKAVGPALQLAQKFGAKILLVHVGDLIPTVLVEYPAIDIVDLESRQRELAAKNLSRFATESFPKEIEVERIVSLGIPHLEIVRLAEERHADLIVMATHGRGFLSHAILGSTTERVLRQAPCPVMAVRDSGAKEP